MNVTDKIRVLSATRTRFNRDLLMLNGLSTQEEELPISEQILVHGIETNLELVTRDLERLILAMGGHTF